MTIGWSHDRCQVTWQEVGSRRTMGDKGTSRNCTSDHQKGRQNSFYWSKTHRFSVSISPNTCGGTIYNSYGFALSINADNRAKWENGGSHCSIVKQQWGLKFWQTRYLSRLVGSDYRPSWAFCHTHMPPASFGVDNPFEQSKALTKADWKQWTTRDFTGLVMTRFFNRILT